MTSFRDAFMSQQQQYMVPMFGQQAKMFGQQQAAPMMPGMMNQQGDDNNPFYLAWLRQFAGRPSMEGHGY